jgi:hypothetical protein
LLALSHLLSFLRSTLHTHPLSGCKTWLALACLPRWAMIARTQSQAR